MDDCHGFTDGLSPDSSGPVGESGGPIKIICKVCESCKRPYTLESKNNYVWNEARLRFCSDCLKEMYEDFQIEQLEEYEDDGEVY